MSNIFARSTDGSDADNGTTWALAKATLAGAAAIDAAGDTIFVSQNHAESTAGNISVALAGTLASPTKIICGNDSAEPPTAVAATGTVTTTGASTVTFSGISYLVSGLVFQIGTGANNSSMNLTATSNARAHFKECDFYLNGTSSGTLNINSIAGEGSVVILEDCRFKFALSSHGLRFSDSGKLIVKGGSIISGGTTITALFVAPGSANYHEIDVSGLDLTNLNAATHIFTAGNMLHAVIRNSKLPASWTGTLVTGTIAGGSRYEMYNCDDGDTNYLVQIIDFAGTLLSETTIVRTGGASDGATSLSWKMASSADAEYPQQVFASPEIVVWNETTGSAITATVEVVTDNVTLNNDECWLEVQYLGTSGFPLGTFADDCKADLLATAAAQTSSSETWTTTGLTTPVKQKLSVTFTPQEKGPISVRVMLAKASKTLYVCPKVTIS